MSEAMAYIGRDANGCVLAATVDDPKHIRDVAREIASWVRLGDTLERMAVEQVRALDFGHRSGCPLDPRVIRAAKRAARKAARL